MQVRLVAGSPKASKRSHLNPGFKVVSQASPSAEDYSFKGVDPLHVDPVLHNCTIDWPIVALIAATINPRTGRDFAPDLFYPPILACF